MSKKLTIILGAGASYSQNTDPKPLDHQEYRPPLTQGIFSRSRSFGAILHKYPLVETIASDINRRLKQNKPREGLEQILRSYEERLLQGEDSIITRQFLQVPLYLNDLFGEVSQHFTTQPDEYNTLVSQAVDHADQILFLTLNYDTLLEIPLSINFSVDFSKSSHYTSNPKWMLVKLHGSINWYRGFNSYQMSGTEENDYFENLKSQTLPLSLSDKYMMTAIPGHQHKFIGNSPTYPAITIPVDGKYKLSCPPEMLERAKSFLKECENFLIIGTSGNDKDLLDLLKENAKGGNTLIVGCEEESTKRTNANFLNTVPQLGGIVNRYFHKRGFSEFVDSGELDNFLVRLR
ncbi:SIR2 family protein [Candidatus Microgenomates bacterium]|nr:SIR2 family protein [Candidatus Microgenomates bacterium]